jgi:hypothetical protein
MPSLSDPPNGHTFTGRRAWGSRPTYSVLNPFNEWTVGKMEAESSKFAIENGMSEYAEVFVRAGKLLLDPRDLAPDDIGLTEDEKNALKLEHSENLWDRFAQSRGLWRVVILCSAAAAGKDATAKHVSTADVPE